MPVIRLLPDLFQMFEEFELHVPAGFIGVQAAAPRLMIGVHDLAEHVELELRMGGIADAHRVATFS